MIGIQLTYKAPETLKEALDLVGREGHQILTADQSLISDLKKGVPSLHTLVSLRKIPGLSSINIDNGELRIGASASYNSLLTHEALNQYPALAQALATIPDPHLRHHSTFGGALSHGGRIHAPVLAALMALDASVVVLTRDNDTRLPIHYFSQNGNRVLLPQGGLITMIVLPEPAAKSSAYLTVNQLAGRQANHGIAISLTQSGDTLDQIRLILAGFTEQPIRLKNIEEKLAGSSLTPDSIKSAADQLGQDELPIHNDRIPEGYQRHLAGVLLQRALKSLTKQTVS